LTLEAERLFREAIRIDSPDAAPAGASPMLLTNWARALRDLDRLDQVTRLLVSDDRLLALGLGGGYGFSRSIWDVRLR
jgi:hypothetical protein